MPLKRSTRKKPEPRTVRCSITFPTEHYQEFERLAKQKKVSVAWVVREAMERYLAEQWPLLRSHPPHEIELQNKTKTS